MAPLISKKPNIVWAFFICLACSFHQPCRADFFEEQIKPVQERAFDSTSTKLILSGLLSTGLASTQDSKVRSAYGDNKIISADNSKYGNEFGTYLVGPAIALGQLYWDHDNGVSHSRSLIYTTLITHVLKESIRRERPDSSNHQSMPSGHSSSAFATATSLTYAYGPKAAAIAYPVATFVALSRVADDVHWFSDVVAGAFIGVWMGRATFYSTEKVDPNKQVFMPVINCGNVGLLWEREF